MHTITAKVSFQNFKKNYKSDPLLFRIPPNYTEENIQDALFKDAAAKKEPTPPSQPQLTSSGATADESSHF